MVTCIKSRDNKIHMQLAAGRVDDRMSHYQRSCFKLFSDYWLVSLRGLLLILKVGQSIKSTKLSFRMRYCW